MRWLFLLLPLAACGDNAWVGDNRRDWLGFHDALDHLFRSAAAGYAVIGSDIGGYLDKDDENLADVPCPSTDVHPRPA